MLRFIETIARRIADWAERAIEKREGAGDFGSQFARMLQARIKVRIKS